LFILGFAIAKKNKKRLGLGEHLLVYVIGGLFASGLLIAGMSRRANVLHFLQINSDWNPSLLLVLGFGVGLNLISFAVMRKRGKSIIGNAILRHISKDQTIDWKVFVGGLCFGLGWGIGGICPGPFYVLFPVITFSIQILWGFSFIIGTVLGAKLSEGKAKIKVKVG
jgi:uncharacterized membrane protein YedE/YeeE